MCLATTTSIAQEMQEEMMFVSITYVSIAPGMNQAFEATVADHLEWHKSTNDTHYYGVSQVTTGPRTGQMAFVAGPMTGAALDEYNAFQATDMADWASRGGFNYVDGVEAQVISILPGMGNPPPAGYEATMVNVYDLEIDFSKMQAFMEGLAKFEELNAQVGYDGYGVWTTVISGGSFTTRSFVAWVDGWADMADQDPEREAKMAEAAGGQEAYLELIATFTGAIKSTSVSTHVPLPHLSFRPNQ